MNTPPLSPPSGPPPGPHPGPHSRPHLRPPAASIAAAALAGGLLMLLGLVWLCSNLGFFDGLPARAVSAWPVILILLGLSNLLGRRQNRSMVGPLFIAAGVWALAIEQGWLAVDFWAVFAPTVVSIIGAAIIWRAYHRGPFTTRLPGAPEVPADAYIRVFSMFSGAELRPSLPFEGAHVSAIMGGAKLDLSRTPMALAEASVDVFLLMGGVEIIVPPDWEVTVAPLVFMGGVADKRRTVVPPVRRLFINGGIVMGGIEIKD